MRFSDPVFSSSTFSADATIKVYTTSAIRERIDCRLTGDAFLTFAVCCGGDYDKVSWLIPCAFFFLVDEIFHRGASQAVAVRLPLVLLAA